MVDDIGSPFRHFRLEVASSVVGAVAAAAPLGLLAWGAGLQLGLGGLDARTKALDAGLEQTRAVLREPRAPTRENSPAVRDLLNRREGAAASPGP